MESPEEEAAYEDAASCDKRLESMQSLRPLLNGEGADFFHPFQALMSAGEGGSGGGGYGSRSYSSAVVDTKSPTSENLQILDSPAMLNSYEQDMLLSSFGTSSSKLRISCDELFPQITDFQNKWSLNPTINEPSYPTWKLKNGEDDNHINHNSVPINESRSHGELRHLKASNYPLIKEACSKQDQSKRKWSEISTNQEISKAQLGGGEPKKRLVSGESKWALSILKERSRGVGNGGIKGGVPRVSSSSDLFKQLDSSDNYGDEMEDIMEEGRQRRGNSKLSKRPISKNLILEKRRRQKLNERLYSLRALVPTISKMDKASIVGDAVNYVRDLQKQVEEVEMDIAILEASKDAVANGLIEHAHHIMSCYGEKVVLQEHQILELDVTPMEEQTYHIRIHCKRSPGVLVQLTQALEALEFEIVNANFTSVNDHILNTLVIEVNNGHLIKSEDVRRMTLEVIPKFGIFFES